MHNGDEEQFCAPCEPRKRGSEGAEGDEGEWRWKKRAKKTCTHPEGCGKRVQNGGLCKEHGGTQVRVNCKHPEGCDKWAQKGGFCIAHGGIRNKCKHPDGCEKQAQKGGFCMKHGGVYKCKHADGCEKQAKKGGLCKRHFKAEQLAQVQQNFEQLEQQGEEEDKCAICIGEFTDKTQLIDYGVDDDDEEAEFAVCKHEFCFVCISKWCLKSKSCPLCRKSYSIIEGESGERKVLRPLFVGAARAASDSPWVPPSNAGDSDDEDFSDNDSDDSWLSDDVLEDEEDDEDDEHSVVEDDGEEEEDDGVLM